MLIRGLPRIYPIDQISLEGEHGGSYEKQTFGKVELAMNKG